MTNLLQINQHIHMGQGNTLWLTRRTGGGLDHCQIGGGLGDGLPGICLCEPPLGHVPQRTAGFLIDKGAQIIGSANDRAGRDLAGDGENPLYRLTLFPSRTRCRQDTRYGPTELQAPIELGKFG